MFEAVFVTVTVPFLAVFTAVMGLHLWREAGRPGRVRVPQVAQALFASEQALTRWVPDDTCPDWLIRLALAVCTVRTRIRRALTDAPRRYAAMLGYLRRFVDDFAVLLLFCGGLCALLLVTFGVVGLVGVVAGLACLYLAAYLAIYGGMD